MTGKILFWIELILFSNFFDKKLVCSIPGGNSFGRKFWFMKEFILLRNIVSVDKKLMCSDSDFCQPIFYSGKNLFSLGRISFFISRLNTDMVLYNDTIWNNKLINKTKINKKRNGQDFKTWHNKHNILWILFLSLYKCQNMYISMTRKIYEFTIRDGFKKKLMEFSIKRPDPASQHP